MTSREKVSYKTLDELDAERLSERFVRAKNGASLALAWLKEKGIRAGVIGSFARGDFTLWSDVDFVIEACPEALRYTFEDFLERFMSDIPFDVIYKDEVSDLFKQKIEQDIRYECENINLDG